MKVYLGLFLLLFYLTFSKVTKQHHSLERLLELTRSSRPAGIDPEFDCAWRSFALTYSRNIQPWISADQQKLLYDALELGTLCNSSFAPVNTQPLQRTKKPAPIVFYVDAQKGNDNNNGTIHAPFQTISVAVASIRTKRSSTQVAATILLRDSAPFYLSDTLILGHLDSNITITAFRNEKPVISGGRQITGIKWSYDPKTKVYSTKISNSSFPNGVQALQINGSRVTLARYPNSNPELDLFPKGYIVSKTYWKLPQYNGVTCNPNLFCGQSYNRTIPVSDAWHGMFQNFTVGYGGACSDLDPPKSPWCSGDFTRSVDIYHTRKPSGVQIDGLLPNSPYEHPDGAIVHAWRDGHWFSLMFEVDSVTVTPAETTWHVYPNLNAVYGHAHPRKSGKAVKFLGVFSSAEECFAACNRTEGCTMWTFYELNMADPNWRGGCYSPLELWNAVPQEHVTSGRVPQPELHVLNFGRGGNQGAEGSDSAAEWWIDNVFEELDAPNEYFYNSTTEMLYLIYNGTGIPPSEIVVPTLANIIELRGSQEYPVSHITIEGIKFTQNRPTFLEPRGNPSGGDWSLERLGAIFMKGTKNVRITHNEFTKLDSNAVFLSEYNRRAEISYNSFSWLGLSAIASWGQSDENDGTNGNQPRISSVFGNFAHEIGIIQRQSSFYFQAETCQATIKNNIVFNVPRAAINFNDGFGGANEMAHNLLFNTCRESSDHGAFNSWDRLPYITDVSDRNSPSSVPADNDVHHNFIVANYAADGGCLDNDDGSSYYNIRQNFCVFGGHKSDFDGHSKRSFGNLHVFPTVYAVTCIAVLAQSVPPARYAEGYYNNTCILPNEGALYLQADGISGGNCLDGSRNSITTFRAGLTVSGNSVYVPNGNAVVNCGGKTISAQEFIKLGYDLGSTVYNGIPSAGTIITWAKQILLN